MISLTDTVHYKTIVFSTVLKNKVKNKKYKYPIVPAMHKIVGGLTLFPFQDPGYAFLIPTVFAHLSWDVEQT